MFLAHRELAQYYASDGIMSKSAYHSIIAMLCEAFDFDNMSVSSKNKARIQAQNIVDVTLGTI
jgi:hypothetical protein